MTDSAVGGKSPTLLGREKEMDCPGRFIWSGGFQGWCTWTIAAVIFALAPWPAGAASPAEARGALGELKAAVERAKAKQLDTLYAEVWLRVGPRFLDDEHGKMADAARRDDWAAFLQDGIDEIAARRLEGALSTGRPLGAEAFVEGLERRTGRSLRRRRPGPPKSPWSHPAPW